MKTSDDLTREVTLKDSAAEGEQQEGCGAAMRLLFCNCTPRANFKSMFQRKPSALAPLDGMRFMAVFWVILIHNCAATFEFYKCRYLLEDYNDKLHWMWVTFNNGDLGVDIFFVLSGFLITFMLSREYNKYGDIDWSHFMKMRLLRLYPAYISFLIVASIGVGCFMGIKYAFTWTITALFFIGNLVGTKIHYSHLWSVCVEMQFYIFSPFLVKKLMRSEKPWMIPAVVTLVSTILNFVIPMIICPQSLNDGTVWLGIDLNTYEKNPDSCYDMYFWTVYE